MSPSRPRFPLVEDDGTAPDNNSPPVEEFVPGIKVTTDSDSATIAFPAFGVDGAYVVQRETKDGDWTTLDATVEDAPADSTRDYVATIDDLKAGKTYTVRIVTAPTEALAEAATEDAVELPDAGRGSSVGAIARTPANAANGDTSSTTRFEVSIAALPDAGEYSLNWSAADPKLNSGSYLPTYDQVPPSAIECPTPTGTGGRAADPMKDAVFHAHSKTRLRVWPPRI